MHLTWMQTLVSASSFWYIDTIEKSFCLILPFTKALSSDFITKAFPLGTTIFSTSYAISLNKAFFIIVNAQETFPII